MSGPYAEGWRRENPDALGSRTVETVQLPHVLVSDELVERALRAYDADTKGTASAVHAALDAVAGELWQAGYDAGRKRIASAIFDES